MAWKKGQSGNPGGRTRGAKGLAKYIQKKTNDGRAMVDFVIAVAEGREIPTTCLNKDGEEIIHKPKMADRMWAIQYLTDRGFGKALETIEFNDVTENTKELAVDVESMTPAQLAEIRKLLEPPKEEK